MSDERDLMTYHIGDCIDVPKTMWIKCTIVSINDSGVGVKSSTHDHAVLSGRSPAVYHVAPVPPDVIIDEVIEVVIPKLQKVADQLAAAIDALPIESSTNQPITPKPRRATVSKPRKAKRRKPLKRVKRSK